MATGSTGATRRAAAPGTSGLTSGGAVWTRLVESGKAPRAMLLSKAIDSLAAGGLMIADLRAGQRGRDPAAQGSNVTASCRACELACPTVRDPQATGEVVERAADAPGSIGAARIL